MKIEDMNYDDKEQIEIEILNNMISLDHPCSQCVESFSSSYYRGPDSISGYKKGYQNNEHCDLCKNIRFGLTDEGKAIMALVKRHT